MNWSSPKEIIGRRKKERDLFFNNTWTSGFKILKFPVKKTTYTPDFRKRQVLNIEDDLDKVFDA